MAIISLAFAAWLSVRLADSNRRRTEVLVEATVTAPDENFPGLVEALRTNQAAARVPLREIIADPKRPAGQKGNAALALAAFGDSVSTARPILALAEDPSGRTKFIHGYPRFHGDLAEAAQALEASKADPAAADFRSGLCAALGLMPWDKIGPEEQAALRKTLVGLYTGAPDGRTHSAAYFALMRWGQEKAIPTLAPSKLRPADDRDWLVNSLGMTMIRIPHGSFTMGEASSQAGSEEKPPHKVTLTKDFYLCDREVTVRQFREFSQQAADHPKCTAAEKEIAEIWGWRGEDKKVSPKEDCPVQQVCWFEALAFCNWVSHCEGLTPCYSFSLTERGWKPGLNPQASGYRLPTEAQWEYACRSVSQMQYPFGDDERLLPEYGYYYSNSKRGTSSAGRQLPNGWGLFDMHGNVWEWCQDGYAEDYYAKSPASDPPGPSEDGPRVSRGGSWDSFAAGCRASVRGRDEPNNWNGFLGLRLAAVPQAKFSSGPGSR